MRIESLPIVLSSFSASGRIQGDKDKLKDKRSGVLEHMSSAGGYQVGDPVGFVLGWIIKRLDRWNNKKEEEEDEEEEC